MTATWGQNSEALERIESILEDVKDAVTGATPQALMTGPRRFVLDRRSDPTGISGTGVVAEGVEFSDGVVALRWLVPEGNPGAGDPTSVVFHDNGVGSVYKIHGHGGQTEVVWLDEVVLKRCEPVPCGEPVEATFAGPTNLTGPRNG